VDNRPPPPEPQPSAWPPVGYTGVPEKKPKSKASDSYGMSDADGCAVGLFGIVVLIVIIITVSNYLSERRANICTDPYSFQCVDHRVQECIESEKYSKEQCVILVGGNK